MLFLDVNKEQRLIHGVPSSRYVMSFRSIVMTSRPAASLCRVRIASFRRDRCRAESQLVSKQYVVS